MRQLFNIIMLAALSLSVYAQDSDTLKKRITRQWMLSDDFTEEINIPVDTAFNLFHQSRISDKFSAFNAYPGNYGLPLYQLNFFDRVNDPDNYLLRYYYPFMHLPGKAVFMNTQVPFSEMVFNYAGPRDRSEQVFRVRHSQNAGRYLNFGLIYDVIYSLGQYSYQRSDDKTFLLHASYTGDKYKVYAAAGINNINNLENGGIADSSQLETYETRDVEVRLGSLSAAKTTLKNRNLLIVQRFSINKMQGNKGDTSSGHVEKVQGFRLNGIFSHILVAEKTRRSYSDSYPLSGLYDSIYISSESTFDSLSSGSLKNTLRFDFSTDERRKFRLGGGVGIRNELFRYSQIIPTGDTLLADTASWRESNNLVTGRLFNNIGTKLRWAATGELFLTGYRSGDFSLKGHITKEFDWKKGRSAWNITGNISSTRAPFWVQHYQGNHFIWSNSFDKEFRIDAETTFDNPAHRFFVRFNYAIIDNHIYFDENASPAQHGGGLSVAALFIRKELSLWKFHLSADILLQQSSNGDVLDLPLTTLRTAGFFSHNFHFKLTDGNLNTQLGVELLYHTPYHAYSYMPASGLYYNTLGNKTGSYPFINAFLNMKIKRTRIFLMLDHFNAGLNGYNYFLVPSYPINTMMFRYGLAWTFYD